MKDVIHFIVSISLLIIKYIFYYIVIMVAGMFIVNSISPDSINSFLGSNWNIYLFGIWNNIRTYISLILTVLLLFVFIGLYILVYKGRGFKTYSLSIIKFILKGPILPLEKEIGFKKSDLLILLYLILFLFDPNYGFLLYATIFIVFGEYRLLCENISNFNKWESLLIRVIISILLINMSWFIGLFISDITTIVMYMIKG